MKSLVLATANPDKAREVREILAACMDLELLERPSELGEVDETGATLEENAGLKATSVANATGMAAVADDTGLFVDALGGAPGVYSARYAGERATYADNVAKLLASLEGIDATRTARFQTAVVVADPSGVLVSVLGSVEGTICAEPRGANGFGYDPVFVPLDGDGRTLAEMSDADKHAISHRGRALRLLAERLTEEV